MYNYKQLLQIFCLINYLYFKYLKTVIYRDEFGFLEKNKKN